MSTTVSIEEAEVKLKVLLSKAQAGDEILISENGVEIGKIVVSVTKSGVNERKPGLGRGSMSISDDFNDELPDAFWGFDRDEL